MGRLAESRRRGVGAGRKGRGGAYKGDMRDYGSARLATFQNAPCALFLKVAGIWKVPESNPIFSKSDFMYGVLCVFGLRPQPRRWHCGASDANYMSVRFREAQVLPLLAKATARSRMAARLRATRAPAGFLCRILFWRARRLREFHEGDRGGRIAENLFQRAHGESFSAPVSRSIALSASGAGMDIPAASLMHLICVNTGLKSPSSSPVAP